jgi:hypothetical protein
MRFSVLNSSDDEVIRLLSPRDPNLTFAETIVRALAPDVTDISCCNWYDFGYYLAQLKTFVSTLARRSIIGLKTAAFTRL